MTDHELAPVEIAVEESPELVLPFTAEVIDLRRPAEVAQGLQSIRDAIDLLHGYRRALEDVIRLEASRQGTKTLHLGRLTATVTGGPRPEYDPELLERLLIQANMPGPQIREVVKETVTYKVDAARAKRAAAANPAYHDAVDQAKTVVETPWRVYVKTER